VFFHQRADGLAAGDASDGFDVGAEDGLLIGDDGEGFEGGLGELGVPLFLVETLEDVAVLGEGEELVAAGDLFDAEGAAGFLVQGVERLDGLLDRLLALDVQQLAEALAGEGVVGGEEEGLEDLAVDDFFVVRLGGFLGGLAIDVGGGGFDGAVDRFVGLEVGGNVHRQGGGVGRIPGAGLFAAAGLGARFLVACFSLSGHDRSFRPDQSHRHGNLR
jgi:hypothetical protein